jgi:hypothetical protein
MHHYWVVHAQLKIWWLWLWGAIHFQPKAHRGNKIRSIPCVGVLEHILCMDYGPISIPIIHMCAWVRNKNDVLGESNLQTKWGEIPLVNFWYIMENHTKSFIPCPSPTHVFFGWRKKNLRTKQLKKYRDEKYHRFIKNSPPNLNITQVVTNFYYPPMGFALLPNKKWISFLFEFTKGLYNKRMTNPLWIFTIFITSKL